tara:strand:+ start:1031 stop:1207 length:177 start_codon:yes stop_codon:yes gene_type:complete
MCVIQCNKLSNAKEFALNVGVMHGKMICEKCGKVVLFEKIITPENKVYHVSCWERDDK